MPDAEPAAALPSHGAHSPYLAQPPAPQLSKALSPRALLVSPMRATQRLGVGWALSDIPGRVGVGRGVAGVSEGSVHFAARLVGWRCLRIDACAALVHSATNSATSHGPLALPTQVHDDGRSLHEDEEADPIDGRQAGFIKQPLRERAPPTCHSVDGRKQ